MNSTYPDIPVKHIYINANTAQTADRKLSEISVTAGYNTENSRITLTATLSANDGIHTTGTVSNGYAVYEENITVAGDGTPVLVVITNETNNNGYYNGNYFDPTAIG